jgi:peptidyl-prolyl cis-trans isomerase C
LISVETKNDLGKAFDVLAKKFSTYSSGKKGGDLGEFCRNDMVKQFSDVVFKKEILRVHGPVKTKFGYHLIKTIYTRYHSKCMISVGVKNDLGKVLS